MKLNHFTTYQKQLTQHCKSTVFNKKYITIAKATLPKSPQINYFTVL